MSNLETGCIVALITATCTAILLAWAVNGPLAPEREESAYRTGLLAGMKKAGLRVVVDTVHYHIDTVASKEE